jgi:ribosomal protein S18 acetylase RimI-like enzyme
MNTTGIPYSSGLRITVRRLSGRDLSRILTLVRQTQTPPWHGWEFLACVRSHQLVGCVAEVGDQLVGFALCTPVRQMEAPLPSRLAALRSFLCRLLSRHLPIPVCVNLVDLMVCGEWSRSQAEQALLEQLDRELRRRGNPIRVVVPETKLGAQLFLRRTGYRALRVLHDYFGNEDGYLMERQAGGCAAEVDSSTRARLPGKEVAPCAKR